jgi:hypothetical protein
MKRHVTLIALCLLALAASTGRTQERWAEKLFNGDLVHDFGTVAHGAELYYKFKVTNIYAVPLDIAELRVSCGCVTATAPQKTIAPKESAYVEARMDTTRFTGDKSVTIFVSVNNKEYSSSAELKVSAKIRQDVVFNPGQVEFGVVNQGETVTRVIDIDYAGALAKDWKIVGVVTDNSPFEVTWKEVKRQADRVGYRAEVTIKKDAAIGSMKHEIFFKTTDPAGQLVPAFVLATVQAPVTVTPAKQSLGTVAVGSDNDRKVVVRGKKPLKILSVEGADDEITLDKLPTDSADQQQLTIHCKPSKAGEFKHVLKIKTDAQVAPVEVTIEGTVEP